MDEQKTRRSCGPAEVDAGETESSPDLLFLTTDTLTNVHEPGVDRQPALHINVSTDTLPDLDGACQVEPQTESLQFITPTAPLTIAPLPVCQTSSSLEGDQTCGLKSFNDNSELSCDHVRPCVLWPDKASVEGDGTNTTESSLEGQCKHVGHGSVCFFTKRRPITEEINELSRVLSNLAVVPADNLIISEEKRVAFITLESNDPFLFRAPKPVTADPELNQETDEKMPHKTRSKKDKAGSHHHGVQVPKKQESPHSSAQQTCIKQEAHPHTGENHTTQNTPAELEDREAKSVIESEVAAEKASSKAHAKKKKKHGQNATAVRSVPLPEVESDAKPNSAKGRIDLFEAKLGAKAGKSEKDNNESDVTLKKSQPPEDKAFRVQQPPDHTDHKDNQPKNCTNPPNDDAIKRRRLSADKFGKIVSVLESKFPKTGVSIKAKGEEPKSESGATRKKAYSEVVKQKIPPKEGKGYVY